MKLHFISGLPRAGSTLLAALLRQNPLLRYETLTSKPADAMTAVYDFIGEKHFSHDFNNVEFDAEEYDARLGTPGLHRVGESADAPDYPAARPVPPLGERQFLGQTGAQSAPSAHRVSEPGHGEKITATRPAHADPRLARQGGARPRAQSAPTR
jgi:hypothetical protein